MQHRREANLPKLNAGLLSKSFRILSSFCLVLCTRRVLFGTS